MELINPKDLLISQPKLQFFGGEPFVRFLLHLLRFNKLNNIYHELEKEQGIDFIDKLIETLDLKYEFDEAQLNKLPKTGGFITVSNHPFGGLDGILLIKILTMVRPDVKILANPLLKKIDPLKDYFMEANPFDSRNEKGFKGLKQAMEHVRNGGALGVFPSGEVSTYDNYYNVVDKEWQYPVSKFIKKSGVPVVPIYFSGSNSKLFHILGLINPLLSEVRLPVELFNKRKKEISIRIGSPIRTSDIERINDTHQLGRYLRARTCSLGAYKNLEIRKFFDFNALKAPSVAEEVIPAVDKQLLIDEIEMIKANYTLFNIKNYTVFCSPAKLIPNILNETGRLREITFRLVGEGTNHSIDIDEYDLYYRQLFIWDNDENCLVGAYRLGLGSEIIEQYGIHGFYIKSLFKIKNKFGNVLRQSVELGRSFVVEAYQRKPLPLFLLWKGILYFLLKNPQYRYLVGPVSISNNYSKVSKDSIIKFIRANYFKKEFAGYIRPRKAYSVESEDPDVQLLLENVGNDLNKFDKFIGDIDKVNNGIPVLLKKYLSLNAKILAFNVDPNFNNSLDGLILLDIFDVPQNIIESLSKEVNDGSLMDRFYSNRELKQF